MAPVTTDPKADRPQVQEENVYAEVYTILLVGMALSTLCFVAGVILALLHPEQVPLTQEWVRAHYHWRVVAGGLRSGDPAAYMLLGTLFLILTPVARVVASIYAFYVDRDYKYVAVTSAVLFIMALTVVLSRFGLR